MLLDIEAQFHPESAGRSGVSGLDEKISDITSSARQREKTATEQAQNILSARLTQEKDPLVRQDLEILLHQTKEDLRAFELREKYHVRYINVPQYVYGGVRALLDDQVADSRRPAALVRLKKYAGAAEGYRPATELAMAITRERLGKPGLLGPPRAEVEKDLANTKFFIDGIEQLFQKYKIAGYQESFAKLKTQFAAYDDFVRKEVLPVSRTDFRLPKELYDFALTQFGVDIPANELTAMAHRAFDDIRSEMKKVAVLVAKEYGFPDPDYRAVIRELKKKQILGDAILPHYQARIKQIEEIIRREHLVTLPERPPRMRIASMAESASQPAPNMRPPRLIGNTGESGEFVLPLNTPPAVGADPKKLLKYDDFTFDAMSWTLAAHEVRPGHEMQFAAMVENGVSTARAMYAFNSANVEGWGLYAERIMLPFMPPEGRLLSLQARLLRAARAFLDPELHMGKVTPEEASRVLREDVVQSEAMATQEVERYTFRAPAQATSYFYGFTRLNEMRADVEKAMGPRFNQQRFHDYILSQGLLPPALLRKAVFDNFVQK